MARAAVSLCVLGVLGVLGVALGLEADEDDFLGKRIVGGRATNITTHPYQVSVQHYKQHICGGAIISVYYVLTAAHCLEDKDGGLSVRAGSSYHDRGGREHAVVSAVVHPYFQLATFDYDIALLRVGRPFAWTERVQPAPLSSRYRELDEAAVVVVSGWGLLSDRGRQADVLQEVELNVLSNADCDRSFGGRMITARMACTFSRNADACQGDSGGPMLTDKLVGIISWGVGCASNYPGVYTRVAPFRQWIRHYAWA